MANATLEAPAVTPTAASDAAPAKEGGAGVDAVKAAAPVAVAPVVPAKYDLKPPKDSLLDPSALESTAALSRELGLPNEAAQKLVEKQSDAVAQYHQRVMSDFDRQADEWKAQVKNDAKLGGHNYTATEANIQRALADRPALRDLLIESKYVHHPEVAAFLAEIGASRREERLVTQQHVGQAQRSAEDVLYPSQGKKS